jgi:hypothetical protein
MLTARFGNTQTIFLSEKAPAIPLYVERSFYRVSEKQ